MEKRQPMKIKNESESPEAISDGLTESSLVADSELSGSENSSPAINANTRSDSIKTWTSAELAELRSKIGLVAGALWDYQNAGGLVAVTKITYKSPSGRELTATKLILVAEDLNVEAEETGDGLDFSVMPLGKEDLEK